VVVFPKPRRQPLHDPPMQRIRRSTGSGTDRHYVMRQRLFNLAAVLSLVLFVATVVLWLRSYLVADLAQCFKHHSPNSLLDIEESYNVSSGNGGLCFEWGRTDFAYRDAGEAAQMRRQSGYVFDSRYRLNYSKTARWYGGTLYDNNYDHRFAGFALRSWRDTPTSPYGGWGMCVPWVALSAASALLPGSFLRQTMRRRRDERRRHMKLCLACGYDLRSTPDCCPECGAVSRSVGAAA
jgi:hypothetical protein